MAKPSVKLEGYVGKPRNLPWGRAQEFYDYVCPAVSHKATLVIHDGDPEQVFTESEWRAKSVSAEAVEVQKMIDTTAELRQNLARLRAGGYSDRRYPISKYADRPEAIRAKATKRIGYREALEEVAHPLALAIEALEDSFTKPLASSANSEPSMPVSEVEASRKSDREVIETLINALEKIDGHGPELFDDGVSADLRQQGVRKKSEAYMIGFAHGMVEIKDMLAPIIAQAKSRLTITPSTEP